MYIVSLVGSPRKDGNSAFLAERFLKTARNLGAETDNFYLNQLSYKGCQACLSCKTDSDRCVQDDDLTDVLESIRKADVLVLSTPVYFGEVSSQMKAFIDRAFSFLVPDYMTNPNKSRIQPGKKLVFIQSQENPDENAFTDIFPRYEFYFRWYGFDSNQLIRSCGNNEPGSIEKDKKLLDQIDKIADSLVE